MYDYCVIGGGIVGVATAHRLLQQRPDATVLLLEKGDGLAQHQTGHNSGVIHSGIYYEPGSLKAELCRRGAEATKQFAQQHGLEVDVRGKLLVATNAAEQARMMALYERSKTNRLEVEVLDAAELRRREPRVTGVGALFVPSTGIIDFREVADALAGLVRHAGGQVRLGVEITGIDETTDSVVVSGPGVLGQRSPPRISDPRPGSALSRRASESDHRRCLDGRTECGPRHVTRGLPQVQL